MRTSDPGLVRARSRRCQARAITQFLALGSDGMVVGQRITARMAWAVLLRAEATRTRAMLAATADDLIPILDLLPQIQASRWVDVRVLQPPIRRRWAGGCYAGRWWVRREDDSEVQAGGYLFREVEPAVVKAMRFTVLAEGLPLDLRSCRDLHRTSGQIDLFDG